MTPTWKKWMPAAVVPAVIVAGALVLPFQANASAELPQKSPQQLLEFVAESDVTAFSGTVEQASDLGLPDLSGIGGDDADGAASAIELVTGSHTARVYVDGADLARMQVLDSFAERNVVRNGADVWFSDTESADVTHVTLPEKPDAGADERFVRTPSQLAAELLAQLDGSTEVSVGDGSGVAGRAAYDLVLTPRDAGTLIASVSIAVDGETGLPLAVEVSARGQDAPAFRIAFSSLTLAAPDAAVFDFAPPPGTTVTERELPAHDKGAAGQAPAVTEHGDDWTSVVEIAAADLPADALDSPILAAVAEPIDGGRLLSTALVNVYLTDDGRVFAGAVTPELLLAAAGR